MTAPPHRSRPRPCRRTGSRRAGSRCHRAATADPAALPAAVRCARTARPVRSCSSRPLVPIVVALGYPLVRQFVLSFQEYGLAQQFGRPAEWVGPATTTPSCCTDPYVWGVIARSIAFCLVNAALTMVDRRRARGAHDPGRPGRPDDPAGRHAAGLGHAGAGHDDGLAVAVRLAVRRHQLAARRARSASRACATTRGSSSRCPSTSSPTVIVVWMSVPFVVFSVYAGLLQVPERDRWRPPSSTAPARGSGSGTSPSR